MKKLNKKAILGAIFAVSLIAPTSALGYTPSYSYSSGSTYTPDYSYSSGSSYTPSYSYSGGSSYTPSYSYSSGSSYTPSYSYSSGSSYTPSYSYSSGSSYSPSYSYSSGSSYKPSYSYSSGSSYSPSYTYSSGSSYTPSYSYSSGSTYNPSYTYGSGSSYSPSYSYSSGSSYSPSYTYDSGSTYSPSYTYDSGSNYVPDSGSYSNQIAQGGGSYDSGYIASNVDTSSYYQPFPYQDNGMPYYGYDDYEDPYYFQPIANCGSNCYVDTGCTTNCGGCTHNCNNEVDENISLSCVASPYSVTKNQTVTFVAHASGNDSGYSYSWSGDVSGNGKSISKFFSSTGIKNARVTATKGNKTKHANCSVDVIQNHNDLSAYCEASPSRIEEGESVTWRVTASGGDGDYSYSWSGDVSGNNRTETKRYTSSGTKNATVRITSDGKSITRTCTTYVEDEDNDNNDNLRAVCEVSPSNPDEGDTVRWSVKVYGGDGDYDYKWTGDVTGNNRTETKRYSSSGRKEATVRIESDGETIRKTCSVHVDDEDNNRNNNSYTTTYSNPTYTTPGTGAFASGVLLSSLPYTGISGNMKTALFVIGLMLWSGLLAHIFIKKQKSKTGKGNINIENFKRENMLKKGLA